MWPSPPAHDADLLPFATFQWRSGEYVVMPAHSSATPGIERLRHAQHELLVDDDAVRIAAEVTPPESLSARCRCTSANSGSTALRRVALEHSPHESTMQPTAARSPP